MIEGWHYQNAYICDDIEAALKQFATRAEIGNIPIIDVDQTIATPDGPKRMASRLAFVWIGDMQYELIQIVDDQSGVYHNYKDNGGTMHFHHICMRIDDWDDFRARVDQQDLPLVLEREHDDHLKFLYLDGRSFCGHYLEYVWCTDERWAMMGGPAR